MSLGVQKRLGHAYIVGASALFMEAIDFSWFLNADSLTAIFRGRLHTAIGYTRTCSHGHEDADVRRLWRTDASALQRNQPPYGKDRNTVVSEKSGYRRGTLGGGRE